MKQLKQLIVDSLCKEYPLEEAIKQVEEAVITIKKDTITVVYDNGVTDVYKVELIEKLIHMRNINQ